jgi:hypothetical protein
MRENHSEIHVNIGPLVRIGPNQLLSVDPDVLRRMSAVRSGYTKGKFYASGRIVPGVDKSSPCEIQPSTRRCAPS